MPEDLATVETASAVESTVDTDQALPDNYLDDPGESFGDGEQVDSDSTESASEQPEQAASPLESRIQELAKTYGLNPNDPKQRKALEALAVTEKRMGDKDAHIAKLQKLTPFEESLQKPQEQQADSQQFAPQQQVAAGAQWQDPFPHWRGPEDALNDWLGALNEAVETKNFTKAATIHRELFRREMLPYREAIENMIQERISRFEQERLGDVLPAVRQTVAERTAASNRQFAEKQLGTDPQFAADLSQLRKPLSDKVHEFEGEQYPDTMLNRIVLEKPYILRIRVDHQDPRTAQILTHMEQLRAIRREMASQQNTPAKGKELVRAGMEMAKREGQERARQTLNSGSSSGGNSKAANNDYISEIERTRPRRLSDFK